MVVSIGASLALALCMVIVQSAANNRVYKTMSEMPNYHVALVLGAGVQPNGALSWTLRHRVNTAIDLYNAGRVEKILMSGDNRVQNYNEPQRMADYAVSQGVPSSDVVMDYAGRRTYDSVYRAKNIFLLDKLVIVTQGYHLPRALFLARSVGLEAYGVAAPATSDSRAPIREYPASISAVIDAYVLHPSPVMGKIEPID